MADRSRIVLADDDLLLREGLTSLLGRSDFEVVGQAADADGLLQIVGEQAPDLAIIDVRMPPGHSTEGLGAALTIQQDFPGVAILILSAHVEVDVAMEVLARGSRVGYLLKSRVTDVSDFINKVQRIMAGDSVVDPDLVQELFSARRRNDPLDALSPREHEVLGLMAQGYSNAGIARMLYVTEGTVEKHVHSLLPKLQLPDSRDDHRRVLAVLAFLESR